ncbi:MAG: polyprenyl synthetase family protein [Armatimonadota bacterium]|nr:polyprenyl synthetase family protein [Armatimonadota bacterium]
MSSASAFDLQAYLRERVRWVDEALERFLPDEGERPQQLHRAMRYSTLSGGKRLRPVLVIAGAEAVGGEASLVMPTACAIELIHTFSLIHDDLPAIDNDTLRRGRPTCHVQFGEATAILAGDALFASAFELIARNAETAPAERVVQVLRLVAEASGTRGMVGGQMVDIESEGKPVDADTLEYIHRHKTAALIRASVLSGAVLAGANQEQLKALSYYGECVGLAFQIADDLLNVLGDPRKMGKAVGTDAARGKATYPALFGVDASRRRAYHLVQEAVQALRDFGEKAEPLRAIAHLVVEREG